MDEDLRSYAVPTSEYMPPENRASCLAEANDVLRRIIALHMARAGVNNLNYTKFELDLAPVKTLIVKRDKQGNVNVTH
jgi:hypothetical protein